MARPRKFTRTTRSPRPLARPRASGNGCRFDGPNVTDELGALDRLETVATTRPALSRARAEATIVGGEPSKVALRKEIPALDGHARAFIARSPFLLLGTASANGRCDVSPKGDAPGFVRVIDDRHLVIPDRPGNKRLGGMRNILANPHVGILFLVPGNDFTLRVNGRAAVTREPELLRSLAAQGKIPLLAIGVEVEEVFLHCARSFRRGRLWDQAAWPGPGALPSMACMLYDQTGGAMSLEALEARTAASLTALY